MPYQLPTSSWPQQQETNYLDILRKGFQVTPPNQEQQEQSYIGEDLYTLSGEYDQTGNSNNGFWTDMLYHPLPTQQMPDSAVADQQPIAETTVTPNVTETINQFIQKGVNSTIDAVKNVVNSASNSNSTAAVDGTSVVGTTVSPNVKETFTDVFTTNVTDNALPNIPQIIKDVLNTTTEKSLEFTTKLPLSTEKPLFESSTSKDLINAAVANGTTGFPSFTETAVNIDLNGNITSVLKDVFTTTQQAVTDIVTESTSNSTRIQSNFTTTTVAEIVTTTTTNIISEIPGDSNATSSWSITTSMPSVTKTLLENTTMGNDTYMKSDNEWIYYVILGIVIAIIIVVVVSLTFLFKKIKNNRKLSAYQVNQMKHFSNSSCSE